MDFPSTLPVWTFSELLAIETEVSFLSFSISPKPSRDRTLLERITFELVLIRDIISIFFLYSYTNFLVTSSLFITTLTIDSDYSESAQHLLSTPQLLFVFIESLELCGMGVRFTSAH